MHEAFGCAQVLPEKVPMGKDAVFDLASVTKVVATATACAISALTTGLSIWTGRPGSIFRSLSARAPNR